VCVCIYIDTGVPFRQVLLTHLEEEEDTCVCVCVYIYIDTGVPFRQVLLTHLA